MNPKSLDPKREIQMIARKVDGRARQTDFAFWQMQPPQARLAALEAIRAEFHHYNDNTEPRLQRVVYFKRINKR